MRLVTGANKPFPASLTRAAPSPDDQAMICFDSNTRCIHGHVSMVCCAGCASTRRPRILRSGSRPSLVHQCRSSTVQTKEISRNPTSWRATVARPPRCPKVHSALTRRKRVASDIEKRRGGMYVGSMCVSVDGSGCRIVQIDMHHVWSVCELRVLVRAAYHLVVDSPRLVPQTHR